MKRKPGNYLRPGPIIEITSRGHHINEQQSKYYRPRSKRKLHYDLSNKDNSIKALNVAIKKEDSIFALPWTNPSLEVLILNGTIYVEDNDGDPLMAEIGRLEKLNNLQLFRCGIDSLTASIGELRNLEHLVINENPFQRLPEQIERLTKLKVLDLSNNKLDSLPPQIGKLEKLTSLILSQNKLTSVPEVSAN